MEQTFRNVNFYEKTKQTIRNLLDPRRHFVYVCNNLQIPNMFRIDDSLMKIWAFYVSPDSFRKVRDYFQWIHEGQFQFHVITTGLIISDFNRKEIFIERNTSRIIDEDFMQWKLYSRDKCSLILVEYRKSAEISERPLDDESFLKSPTITFTPSMEDFKKKRSFIRRPLTKQEIQEKILFIDGEYTILSMDREKKSPLAVAILNYFGKIILNLKITPRGRVLNFGEKFHGISEEKSRNQEDEYSIIKRIQRLTKGKILIGHDLASELRHLMIPKFQLFGIRDFANAKVFGKKSISKKNGGQWYKLKTISEFICGTNIQERFHTAMEDVTAIREIYLKVENEWIDDIEISPMQQTVICNRISLAAYNCRRHQSTTSVCHDEPLKKIPKQYESRSSKLLWTDVDDLETSPDCQILDTEEINQEENPVVPDLSDKIETIVYNQEVDVTVVELRNELVSNEIGVNSTKITAVGKSSVASGTRSWDIFDNFLNDIVVQGERYVRKQAVIDCVSPSQKVKKLTFDFK